MSVQPPRWDAVVIGAGAAGLLCAARAGQRGLRVLLLDHAERVAEKIRISGGGRCNFTNVDVGPTHFLSANPHFCRSALARYTPQDFIAMVQRHGIAFHEKHRGQLFCNRSSGDIIEMLLQECQSGGVERWQPCAVHEVAANTDGYTLRTARGEVRTHQLVVATGGLPVPKIGATDFGLRLAQQFGHAVVDPRPALVPLTFASTDWAPYAALAGLSLEVVVSTGHGKVAQRFLEDLLFTHRGLSGPAILQISSYWRAGTPLHLNLVPKNDLAQALRALKSSSKRQLGNELSGLLPSRLAQTWLEDAPRHGIPANAGTRPMAEQKDRDLDAVAHSLSAWSVMPTGTEGWAKAEVMAGGVDTRKLSSQTLESQLKPGLFFIGEVVDVTGWLGGYNFQWAWASAEACAKALVHRP